MKYPEHRFYIKLTLNMNVHALEDITSAHAAIRDAAQNAGAVGVEIGTSQYHQIPDEAYDTAPNKK